MNLYNLHLLAKVTAEKECRTSVLVLEDALDEAGWFTPANARRVYDELIPGARADNGWPNFPESAREWFALGFRAAEVCEVALSLHGRRFLAAIVTVLESDVPRTDSAPTKEEP